MMTADQSSIKLFGKKSKSSFLRSMSHNKRQADIAHYAPHRCHHVPHSIMVAEVQAVVHVLDGRYFICKALMEMMERSICRTARGENGKSHTRLANKEEKDRFFWSSMANDRNLMA